MWVTLNKDSFRFSVKACWDVHVALAIHPFDNNTNTSMSHEVVIGTGRNTVSGIRDLRNNSFIAENFTGGILDCNEFRNLWISWADNQLMVGKGITIRQSTVLRLNGFNQTTRAVSLTTGYEASGDWVVAKSEGNPSKLQTF